VDVAINTAMALEVIAPPPIRSGVFCGPNAGLFMAAPADASLGPKLPGSGSPGSENAQAAATLPMAAKAADPAIPKQGLCSAA
jgi:hypothetical protein